MSEIIKTRQSDADVFPDRAEVHRKMREQDAQAATKWRLESASPEEAAEQAKWNEFASNVAESGVRRHIAVTIKGRGVQHVPVHVSTPAIDSRIE